MLIKANESQVAMMLYNAVKASKHVGMGKLHSHLPVPKPEQFKPAGSYVSLDYVVGRMVKIQGRKVATDTWEFRDLVDPEYQSWITTYPSFEKLAKSVPGIEVVQ